MTPYFEDNDSRSHNPARTTAAPAAVVLRSVAALLLAPPLFLFHCWLVLCCADFLPSGRDGFALEWAVFALYTSAGSFLPPMLAGTWLRLRDKDFRPVSNLRRLKECSRAVLLSFGAFVPLFYGAVALVHILLPDYSSFYTPYVLFKGGPLFCCIQLYVSWKIVTFLLPPLLRDSEPSSSALLFFCLTWAVALLTLFSPLDALHMDLSGVEGGIVAKSVVFYLLVSLAWVMVRGGVGCLRWIYAAICLVGPLGGLLYLNMYLPPLDIFLAVLRAALALTASLTLFLPSSRRWLA